MNQGICRRTILLLFGLLTVFCTLRAKADATVLVSAGRLSPDPVNIVAGETVFWMDVDGGGYWIYGYSPASWSADSDSNIGVLFTQPGHYPYYDDSLDFGTVIVTANIPPSVTITNPANLAVFTAPASFAFAADASDSDSDGLSDVMFYVGLNLLDDVFSAPFATSVTGLTAGSYTLTAIASDNAGARATNSITITVQNPAGITLANATIVAGKFQFSVTGLTAGKTNLLQSTADVSSAGGWVSVSTNVAASASATFTNAIGVGNHFYRLIQLN